MKRFTAKQLGDAFAEKDYEIISNHGFVSIQFKDKVGYLKFQYVRDSLNPTFTLSNVFPHYFKQYGHTSLDVSLYKNEFFVEHTPYWGLNETPLPREWVFRFWKGFHVLRVWKMRDLIESTYGISAHDKMEILLDGF